MYLRQKCSLYVIVCYREAVNAPGMSSCPTGIVCMALESKTFYRTCCYRVKLIVMDMRLLLLL